MTVLVTILAAGAANTTSPVLSIPQARQNFQGQGVGLLVNFSGPNQGGPAVGTGTATVQVSSDPNANPQGTAAAQALARWNNHDTLVNLSADKNSSIVFPIVYVRLIANQPITGTVALSVSIPDGSNS